MLKFKRFLSVILAVMMLVTSVAVIADETVTEEQTQQPAITFSDITEGSIVEKAVSELVPYGIISGYPDGTFKPDAIITRAEVAKVIVTFLKLQNVAVEGVPTGFSDVDATSHWAQKYIRLAIDYKIVNGYTDGTFKPDDPVKYSEAVKMIVCALGYGELAVNRTPEGGAWYTGYITQAAELGLLQNIVTDKQDEFAPRSIIAILTANALDTKVANNSATQNGGVGVSQGGTTAREEYQKSDKIEGVVVSCSQTSIAGAPVSGSSRYIGILTSDNEIKICTVPYGTNTMQYLGYAVVATVQSENRDIPIINTVSKSNFNTVEVIDASLITRVDANSVSYWESNYSANTLLATFENDMSIVYNGKYLGQGAASYISYLTGVKAGDITLISNDGDSYADVAIINDCKIYAVSSQGTDSATRLKKIYALYGGGDFIVPEKTANVTVNNKGTDVEDTKNFTVSKYDIINLYKSADGSVFNMTVTRNKKSGRVSAISDNKVTIGGNEYEFAYNFAEYTGADKPAFTAGNNATVYLDANGKIAAAENVSNAEGTNVYVGYLIDAATTGGAIEGKTEVEIYGMTSGQKGQKFYEISSNIKVDGVQLPDASAAVAPLKTAHENIEAKASGAGSLPEFGQLIRYTLNKEGKIDTIDTCDKQPGEPDDSMEYSLPFNDKAPNSNNGKYEYASGRKFLDENLNTVIQLETNTPVFVISFDATANKFTYKNTTYSNFTSGHSYKVEAYCMDDTSTPQYLICFAEAAAAEITGSAIVALAIEAIDSSEENKETGMRDYFDKFDGYNLKTGAKLTTQKSEEVEVVNDKNKTKYTTKLSTDIQRGEIFRYAVEDGFITSIEMVLEYKNGKPVLFGHRGTDLTDPSDDYNALDDAADEKTAKANRDVAFDRSSLSSTTSIEGSQNRVVYGTVIGKSNSTSAEKRLSVTNLIYSDTLVKNSPTTFEGVGKNTFALANNAKIFAVDFTALTDDYEKVIIEDLSFDEIAAFNDAKDKPAEASEVLMFVAGGTVRTILIIKY